MVTGGGAEMKCWPMVFRIHELDHCQAESSFHARMSLYLYSASHQPFLSMWDNPQLEMGAQHRSRILPIERILKWPISHLDPCMVTLALANAFGLLNAAQPLTGHMAVSMLSLSTIYSSVQGNYMFLLCFLSATQQSRLVERCWKEVHFDSNFHGQHLQGTALGSDLFI